MPKAIAHPTDSRLLEKSRQHLVKVPEEHGIALRQNYNRTNPRLAAQIGRYAHAKQFERMRNAMRTLRTRMGRVQREVARQLAALPEQAQAKVRDLLARTDRILTQKTKDKTSCTRCIPPRSNASARARPEHPMSSA